jgi:hypothetical protein
LLPEHSEFLPFLLHVLHASSFLVRYQ